MAVDAPPRLCYGCGKPIDAGQEDDAHCHGCGEYFCGKSECPASEHEAEVPFGQHEPEAHLGNDEQA